jgi:hypothetical protein
VSQITGRTQVHWRPKKNKKMDGRNLINMGETEMWGPRTLVVDGIPKSEDGQHGDDNGRGGGVLAIEIASLEAASGRPGRGTLWELGVECDERAEVCTLPRGLLTHTHTHGMRMN